VRDDAVFERKGSFNLQEALVALDRFATGSAYVVGHNLLGHDWPILHGVAPQLALLRLPVIDTLYLSPLAFPENPYQAFIKDYKLVRSAHNNPVADARLPLRMFQDEWSSFQALADRGEADRLSCYRHCFHLGLRSGRTPDPSIGLTQVFEFLGAGPLDQVAAQGILERATRGEVCQTAVRGLLGRITEPADWAGLPVSHPAPETELPWLGRGSALSRGFAVIMMTPSDRGVAVGNCERRWFGNS
jgi:ATP-dependent DNA helicase RecQ